MIILMKDIKITKLVGGYRMYHEIVKTIFAIPTPAETIAAVVIGLACGLMLGRYIDMNGIKSFKEFKKSIIRKNIKNGK
jgi:hypothetical protein